MRYEYRCDDEKCGVVEELIQSIKLPLPEFIHCPRCGHEAFHVFAGAPYVVTSSMTHKTIDVAIGKDAEVRWDRLRDRQAERDKVRRESGKSGLSVSVNPETGKDEYVAHSKPLFSVNTPEPTEK